MRYDDSVIEQVKDANNIVDVVGQYVRLTKKGANYFGLCPFHVEKTASFSVSERKQIYYCFGCGAGGNVFSFLMQHENYSFHEALKALAERAGLQLPEKPYTDDERREKDLKQRLLEVNKEAAYFFVTRLMEEGGEAGLDYFKNQRRFTGRTITHFGLGFAPKQSSMLYKHLREKGYDDELLGKSGLVTIDEKGVRDKFWNRVMFPIMDINNRVIGFGGRVLGDAKPKYLNTQETVLFDKSGVLYGLNFARKSGRDFLLLCEGYTDVISLHQAGFTNAVASLGTAFNERHALLLKRFTDKIYLTQDSDTAGINAKLRAYPILYDAGLNVRVIDIGRYKDPDELIKNEGAEGFERCISEAVNAFIYIIAIIKNNYDLEDPAGRTDFYNETAERLCMFREPLERSNYIDAVSREYMIDRDELYALVEKKAAINASGRTRIRTVSETAPSRARAQTRSESSSLRHERLLLKWALENSDIARIISSYLAPEDFSSDVHIRLAEALFKDSSKLDFALFISRFSDDEDKMSEAVKIAEDSGVEADVASLTVPELEKALTEAVRAVRKSRIERQIEECGQDISALSSLYRQQNDISLLEVRLTQKEKSEDEQIV